MSNIGQECSPLNISGVSMIINVCKCIYCVWLYASLLYMNAYRKLQHVPVCIQSRYPLKGTAKQPVWLARQSHPARLVECWMQPGP